MKRANWPVGLTDSNLPSGLFECGPNALGLKQRVSRQNLVMRGPRDHEIEYVFDADAQAPDAGAAAALGGINGHALVQANGPSLRVSPA